MSTPRNLVLDTIIQWRELIPPVGDDGIAILDMATVDRLDSAGVALLVCWATELAGRPARLELRNLSAQQRALVSLCGVDDLLLAA